MLIILGIILFVLLVVVHEYGHFIAAKKSGVAVEEFGLGFPPKAKTLFKRKGTEYTLNWLPIGGFVRLKGEYDSAKAKGSFGAAPFGKKALIIAAGVLMNWLAAAVIFTIIALVGMPQLIDNQFQVKSDAKVVRQEVFAGFVEEKSPAESIGLKVGDQIISVNNTPITSSSKLRETTKQLRGQQVPVTFKPASQAESQTKNVTLRSDPKQASFGVSPGETKLVRSTWSAPVVGVGSTVQFTAETFKGLYGALAALAKGDGGTASQSVTGPVGIVVVLNELAKQGIVFVLFLIGIISVSLAVMNVLPIPALDGGRLFVMALFRVIKKPLSRELEEKIHGTGMIALLLLAALITVIDVRRFF
jgi:regulator of sigma E protease